MRVVEYQREVWRTLLGRTRSSATERKRAYFYLFALCFSVCMFLVSFLHFVGAWVASGLLQLVMMIFSMLYAINIADCRDKCINVLECERTVNPLAEIYIGFRAVQAVQSLFFLYNVVMAVFFAVALLFLVWRVLRGTFFVDATCVWREIGRLERESYYHLAADILLVVMYIACLLVSIIIKYTD